MPCNNALPVLTALCLSNGDMVMRAARSEWGHWYIACDGSYYSNGLQERVSSYAVSSAVYGLVTPLAAPFILLPLSPSVFLDESYVNGLLIKLPLCYLVWLQLIKKNLARNSKLDATRINKKHEVHMHEGQMKGTWDGNYAFFLFEERVTAKPKNILLTDRLSSSILIRMQIRFCGLQALALFRHHNEGTPLEELVFNSAVHFERLAESIPKSAEGVLAAHRRPACYSLT